jgi:hypothetical protein
MGGHLNANIITSQTLAYTTPHPTPASFASEGEAVRIVPWALRCATKKTTWRNEIKSDELVIGEGKEVHRVSWIMLFGKGNVGYIQ